MGPFKVHVATSSAHVRDRGKEKKKPQDLECLKEEVFITKLNSKFYLIFHDLLYKIHL